jgi:hypothetical protein
VIDRIKQKTPKLFYDHKTAKFASEKQDLVISLVILIIILSSSPPISFSHLYQAVLVQI